MMLHIFVSRIHLNSYFAAKERVEVSILLLLFFNATERLMNMK